MFLWVRLMVDHLRSHITEGQLEDFLSDLPIGLDNAYTRILQRLSAEPLPLRQAVSRFFRWVACAARPLYLNELATVFAIQKGQSSLNNKARPSAPREIITNLCGSLLEIMPDSTIQYVHMSGREFLRSELMNNHNNPLKEFGVSDQLTHQEIAEAGVTYLAFDEFVGRLPREKSELEKTCEKQPYLEYASRYWTHHLELSCCMSQNLLQQVLDFLNSDQALTWLEGPAMILVPSMTGLLVLQSQLNEWASGFEAGTPGVDQIFDVVTRVYKSTYEYSKSEFGRGAEVTIKALTYLGLLHHARGAYPEAQSQLAEVVDLSARRYGPRHNKTLDGISNHALVLQSMGQQEESEHLFRQTLGGWIANDGPNSHNALWGLNNLANSLMQQERNEEAEILFKQAIDGHTKAAGADDMDTLRAATNLSHL